MVVINNFRIGVELSIVIKGIVTTFTVVALDYCFRVVKRMDYLLH